MSTITTYFDIVSKSYKSTSGPISAASSRIKVLENFEIEDDIENYKVVVFRRLLYTHSGYCSGESCEREEQIYAKLYDRDQPEEEYIEEEVTEGNRLTDTGGSGYCGAYVDDETDQSYSHTSRVIVIDTHLVDEET